MSLTSFLNNKDVKEKFKQEFPKPKFGIKRELLAPPFTNHYSLVGTAFDYLLRFYIKYLNPDAITKPWIAETVLEKIKNDAHLYKKASNIVSNAKEIYSVFIKTGQINEDIIKSALLLAQLDPVFRAGVVDENIGCIDNKDIDDLRNLFSLVGTRNFKANKICLLNPTFGEASNLVGGADCDIVLDDKLIDIKTTKKIEMQSRYFDQLIGYYTLYKIGGIDGAPPEHDIKSLGIYFSRYGCLCLIDVDNIIDKSTFFKFIEWFQERAGKEREKIERIKEIHMKFKKNLLRRRARMTSKPSQVTIVRWIHARRRKGEYPPLLNGGKWLIFVNPQNVNEVWVKVKNATEEGKLGWWAQVSTARPIRKTTIPKMHVMCVPTYDWTDRKDVKRIREELRKLGITNEIPYITNVDMPDDYLHLIKLADKLEEIKNISKYYE